MSNNDWWDYLEHAQERTWKKHKYIRKEGNRYIYPEMLKKVKENYREGLDRNTANNVQSRKINKGITFKRNRYNQPNERQQFIENVTSTDFADNIKKTRQTLGSIDEHTSNKIKKLEKIRLERLYNNKDTKNIENQIDRLNKKLLFGNTIRSVSRNRKKQENAYGVKMLVKLKKHPIGATIRFLKSAPNIFNLPETIQRGKDLVNSLGNYFSNYSDNNYSFVDTLNSYAKLVKKSFTKKDLMSFAIGL